MLYCTWRPSELDHWTTRAGIPGQPSKDNFYKMQDMDTLYNARFYADSTGQFSQHGTLTGKCKERSCNRKLYPKSFIGLEKVGQDTLMKNPSYASGGLLMIRLRRSKIVR